MVVGRRMAAIPPMAGRGGGWWRYRPAIVDTVHRRYQLSSIPFTVHTVDTVNADDVIGRMGLTIAR